MNLLSVPGKPLASIPDPVSEMQTVQCRLECSRLTVSVPGRALVRDLEMNCGPGQVIAVLGRNGSGKTSLLHTLAGLRPALAGGVSVKGIEITDWPRRELALTLGLLPQATEDSFPGTVLEAALIGRHPHVNFWQWESELDEATARRCLQSVGLAGLENRDIRTLSGGERRRLAIATVLAQDPQVFLLDEPLQQLDLHHQIDMLKIFRQLGEGRRTVIMSLHDAGLAVRFADYALLLFGDGRWSYGDCADVLNEDTLTALYGTRTRELRWEDGRTFVAS
jgi:iron complex transport system ATP-binding protein